MHKEYTKPKKHSFSVPEITDKELAEVEKIASSLDDDEKVVLVVKRIPEFVSGTIFATNKRIIISQSFLVYGFSYGQLSDVRLRTAPYSYSLVIRIRNESYADETMLALNKRMTEIHGLNEWKDNMGTITGIPHNKGELLFWVVQKGIKEAKN